MITRIRNASAVKKVEVVLPMSKVKFGVAQILKEEGFVNDVAVIKAEKEKGNAFDRLKVVLKYKKSGRSVITNIKRISKPGLRMYAGKDNLPRVLNGFGIAIISTPRGLMTNRKALKEGVGGEVICEVY